MNENLSKALEVIEDCLNIILLAGGAVSSYVEIAEMIIGLSGRLRKGDKISDEELEFMHNLNKKNRQSITDKWKADLDGQ